MRRHTTFRYRLDPTAEQAVVLARHAGAARFAFNQSLRLHLDAGVVTGLPWRTEVCQQVFEEGAVDAGRALKAWTDSRNGRRAWKKFGHPRFKKKSGNGAFGLRNKHSQSKDGSVRGTMRLGETHPRSVTLPGIGAVLERVPGR